MKTRSDMNADFSGDRKFRYSLTRTWGTRPELMCMFIGLKPSVRADENTDDPEVRCCAEYADAWGYHSMILTNLFAYRCARPANLFDVDDSVGELNDIAIRNVASRARLIVAVWGRFGKNLQRDVHVIKMIPNLHVLKLTDKGFPVNVIGQDKSLRPKVWTRASVQHRFSYKGKRK